jgi:hypothetical protein
MPQYYYDNEEFEVEEIIETAMSQIQYYYSKLTSFKAKHIFAEPKAFLQLYVEAMNLLFGYFEKGLLPIITQNVEFDRIVSEIADLNALLTTIVDKSYPNETAGFKKTVVSKLLDILNNFYTQITPVKFKKIRF